MAFNNIQTDDNDDNEKATERNSLLHHKKSDSVNNKRMGEESPCCNSGSLPNSKWERVTSAIRKRLKKDGLRLILLIVLNGVYLYFGGFIFYLLERKPTVAIDKRSQVKALVDTFKVRRIIYYFQLTILRPPQRANLILNTFRI